MTILREEFECVFGWWQLGCIDGSDVVRWCDGQIEKMESGADLPEWLIAVSLQGPHAFWMRAHADDPRPKWFDFATAFRLMVESTDERDHQSLRRFMLWFARNAMGEDLALEEVRAAYEVDDLLDYDPAGALVRTKEILDQYRPSCTTIADKLPWRRAARSK